MPSPEVSFRVREPSSRFQTAQEPLQARLARDGYALIEQAIPPERIGALQLLAVSLLGPSRAGTRTLLDMPEFAELAAAEPLHSLATEALGADAFPVRGIFFDKRPERNWNLALHQDRAIVVREPFSTFGFANPTVKEGLHHLLAPAAVLERMVAVRVHLDDCGADNGALRVVPGSHRLGLIEESHIERVAYDLGELLCVAQAGDALLMAPLLLHGSAAADSPSHRRVLHFEFACEPLPGDLEWKWGAS